MNSVVTAATKETPYTTVTVTLPSGVFVKCTGTNWGVGNAWRGAAEVDTKVQPSNREAIKTAIAQAARIDALDVIVLAHAAEQAAVDAAYDSEDTINRMSRLGSP